MKIISLQPSVSVILDRLGCLDSLAACTRYCLDAVPALRDRGLPVIHDSWSTKTEELLPVAADIVIASVPYRQESLTAILKAGMPALTLSPRNLADIYKDIRLIASIAGVAERGEALVDEMQQQIAVIAERAAAAPHRPIVHCEEWGKPVIHSQLWVAELVELAGGRFAGEPGARTTAEAVAALLPDVMIASWCGAGARVPLEKIVEQRCWNDLNAVKNGQVYCILDELLNTPGPNLVDGLRALAQAIHPEIFSAREGTFGRQLDRFSAQCV
ncbi:ABC transporter substrate-binding protein [Silvibacterium acidisoli]|uniref:ABC transporter substrate-binding protein n=1 Tax=Acidobacteriaceae bacterium ZG23-2 TaxID=2883246 RepID=UPI00406D4A64